MLSFEGDTCQYLWKPNFRRVTAIKNQSHPSFHAGRTMSLAVENSLRATSARAASRSPAVVAATIAAVGILADRHAPKSLDWWITLAVSSGAVWVIFLFLATLLALPTDARNVPQLMRTRWSRRIASFSVVWLVLGWFAIAGAWHHWRWSCRSFDDIANSATDEPQLVQVTGKVIQSPWVLHDSDPDIAQWRSPDRSFVLIECRSLAHEEDHPLEVSGIARVSMDGVISGITIGDVVSVHGDLVLPMEKSNPGDFDQQVYLRGLGISALVRSKSVDAMKVVGQSRTPWDYFKRLRAATRARAERILTESLGPSAAPVALAMLLGTRVQIDEETTRDFRESGLLHILAISGMNVGLLWSCLWSVSRWLGGSARTSIWVVIIGLPLYAFITDANPPIVRATVIALIVALGQLLGRRGSMINSLGIAALAVLIWNPSDLFNPGAQLSFLAVLAIHHATMWLSLVRQLDAESTENNAVIESEWTAMARRFGRAVFDANVIGLAVWLMTTPLIASEFHLVSLIGSVLTVFLVLPLAVLFWIGYAYLLMGLVWPAGFAWLGSLFNLALNWFLQVVHLGASVRWGHAYVPAPPMWWTIGFYAITTLPLLFVTRPKWATYTSVRGGLLWLVLGLIWGLSVGPNQGLTCTFASVGHGLSVMIECPNGRTLLYDAGGMTGGNRIAQTISQTLWNSGRVQVDAIVVSHADGDHCNAIPALSRVVSPGGLFVHRTFLDWNQPAVTSAIRATSLEGAPVQLISAGQSIRLDPNVEIDVMHPANDFRSSRDNPNSIVLLITYAGRRILLTGDLELDGLQSLLKTKRLDVDVLLSPHHGSMKANPPDLARWATPEYVVVSSPESRVAEQLADRYGPETQILATADHGAIRCHVGRDGEVSIVPFKQRNASTRAKHQ